MKRIKMMTNCFQGKLITFCGLDGVGKSTIIKMLVNYLSPNYDVFLTKQPTDQVRSSRIFRTYMDSPDHDEFDYRSLSLLAASDRVQHTNRVIRNELQNGKIVISDRYIYSCIANLHARGYEKDKWIYEITNHLICPDLSVFLDISPDKAIDRVRRRPDEKDKYIDVELQYRLRKEYKKLSSAVKNGVLISTDQYLEQTFLEVLESVQKIL